MHISQSSPVDDSSPAFCAGRKVTEIHKALLWQLLNDDPPVQAAWFSIRSQKRRGRLLSPSVKSIACGRHGGSIEGKGDRAERTLKKKAESQGHLVQVMPRLSFVGVHVFAHWLDQHKAFGPVVAQLTQAVWPISRRIRTMPLPCCIIASRPFSTAFRRCFLRPCWVSTVSASWVSVSIRSRR